MKARQICAVLGISVAVGAVVFVKSLVATNDHQAVAKAECMLKALPVADDAKVISLALDFRPDGHVMQGKPMMAMLATRALPSNEELRMKNEELRNGVWVTKALFAQRKIKKLPQVGEELTFVGSKGAYKLKIAGYLDWDIAARGYPNAFVAPEVMKTIDEEWQDWEKKSAEELSALFMSDAGKNVDRSKPLLLWAAALTALALLLNSLFLTIESRRKEIATLRMIGMTRGGILKLVVGEAFSLAITGLVVGVVLSLIGLWLFVTADAETFPMGMAVSPASIVATAVAAPVVAILGALLAIKSALAVKPLEAASNRPAKPRHVGMLIAFAFGFGAFVAVEVWGTSLMKSFVPSPEWPDAIVSILPGGVSSFDIEKLRKLEGVKRITELQPLQVNLDPLEELKMPGKKESSGQVSAPGGAARSPRPTDAATSRDGAARSPRPTDAATSRDGAARSPRPTDAAPKGRGGMFGQRGKQYRNALLLASEWLPEFKFSAGSHEEAAKLIAEGDNCVITEMMARAHEYKLGDDLKLDCGRGLKLALKIVGIVDLNWHMVTSRGLVRGMNRMPVNTDGPVFVSFDTLAACDGRPQEFVKMTHLWVEYDPGFLAKHGVFPAGRIIEKEIVEALGGALTEDKEGEVRGNTVRLHARDEIADGTLSHGTDIVGTMARIPFIFIAVISLGFIAMLVASAESRRREFTVLHAVGATKAHLASLLVREAMKIALWGLLLGAAGGALAGWLFTSGYRAMMSNWGLPASFDFPVVVIAEGALGALVFALVVAVPASLAIVSRHFRR